MLDSKTVFAPNSVSYLSNSGTGDPKCIPHEPDIISLTLYSRLPVMGSADDGSNGGSAEIASARAIGLRAVKSELKAIVLGIACDLTRTFGLNYPEIPDS